MNSVDERAPTTWDQEASRILRGELGRFGLDKPRVLKERLAEIGVVETTRNLTNKISRGKFSFEFFLQCMRVCGVDAVRVGIEDEVLPPRIRKKPPGKGKTVKSTSQTDEPQVEP